MAELCGGTPTRGGRFRRSRQFPHRCSSMFVAQRLLLMLLLLLLLLPLLSAVYSADREIKVPLNSDSFSLPRSTVSPEAQTAAVRGLLKRLFGANNSKLFDVRVDSQLSKHHNFMDGFRIEKCIDSHATPRSQICITATTGYAAANAVNYYIRKFLHGQVSWSGQRIPLNNPPPLPREPLIVPLLDQGRYYSNVCTHSYSMVWWDWARWSREIDWMALNGINLPLAFTGQELVAASVFRSFGCNETDLSSYFAGPAFLAWNRMGNIRGFGGPLPTSWMQQQSRLQHKILERMRSFGMTPVLSGFNGFLPRAFERYYPQVNFTRASRWNGFPDHYSNSTFLSPTEPFYKVVSAAYAAAQTSIYGTDHFYNIDLFNELVPSTGDTVKLQKLGRAVYESLRSVDSKAVWVMQGWLFVNQPNFWTPERVEAMLTGPPLGGMLILDLFSEQIPVYKRYSNYFGQPFVWCMLHNYGGVSGMFGNPAWIDGPVREARLNIANMVGIGMTPEGTGQNEMMYEFMAENSYRNITENITTWIENYAFARYGLHNSELSEAWSLLLDSVYNVTNSSMRNHGEYVLTHRPGTLTKANIWYNVSDVLRAARLFLDAPLNLGHLCNVTLFHEDLVDIVRQAFQIRVALEYTQAMTHFRHSALEPFTLHAQRLLRCIDVLDEVLSTDTNFLLGKWIADARRSAGDDPKLKDLFEYNARNQISRWGPNGEIRDYASKMWAGVTRDYYGARWRVFLAALDEALRSGTRPDFGKIWKKIEHEVEIPFSTNQHNTTYPAEPSGNACLLRQKIIDALYPALP